MRVTGGCLRGRIAEMPPGVIRPAMDRMRESVFAVIGDINGRSFLDLFTGSGIIALEAASRGAAPVEAVEMDRLKRGVLLKNTAIAPIRINCRFMAVELYIKRSKRAFDYIFCDPPFSYKFKRELAALIAESALMQDGSLLMMHRPREASRPRADSRTRADLWEAGVTGLCLSSRREYGRSIVDFWRMDKKSVSN